MRTEIVPTMYGLRGSVASGRTPIFRTCGISGQAGIYRLVHAGVITRLDEQSFFLTTQASDVPGRARIIRGILPYNTVASVWLAAWIWVGGDFPFVIDLISSSHFRSPILGRSVRVSNRYLSDETIAHIGVQKLTTPVRTACEIACLGEKERREGKAYSVIGKLAQDFNFTHKDCLRFLDANPRWPGHDDATVAFHNTNLQAHMRLRPAKEQTRETTLLLEGPQGRDQVEDLTGLYDGQDAGGHHIGQEAKGSAKRETKRDSRRDVGQEAEWQLQQGTERRHALRL